MISVHTHRKGAGMPRSVEPEIGAGDERCTQEEFQSLPAFRKHDLAGVLNARSGRLTFVEGDCKDDNLFIVQLWTPKYDCSNATHIHQILDNYSIHSSKRTQLPVTT